MLIIGLCGVSEWERETKPEVAMKGDCLWWYHGLGP